MMDPVSFWEIAMRAIGIIVVVLSIISPAIAQMSTDDADQRLADRIAARKAEEAQAAIAATQPSGFTVGQVLELEKQIKELTAENLTLRAAVNNLQQQIQANQVAANAGPSFVGETEPRVGMNMNDIKRLPYVGVELISENTSGAVFRVSTGRIDEYGQINVTQPPSTIFGPQSRAETVVVGSHPAKVQSAGRCSALGVA